MTEIKKPDELMRMAETQGVDITFFEAKLILEALSTGEMSLVIEEDGGMRLLQQGEKVKETKMDFCGVISKLEGMTHEMAKEYAKMEKYAFAQEKNGYIFRAMLDRFGRAKPQEGEMHTVIVREILEKSITLTAASREKAKEAVLGMYLNGDIVLDSDDFVRMEL